MESLKHTRNLGPFMWGLLRKGNLGSFSLTPYNAAREFFKNRRSSSLERSNFSKDNVASMEVSSDISMIGFEYNVDPVAKKSLSNGPEKVLLNLKCENGIIVFLYICREWRCEFKRTKLCFASVREGMTSLTYRLKHVMRGNRDVTDKTLQKNFLRFWKNNKNKRYYDLYGVPKESEKTYGTKTLYSIVFGDDDSIMIENINFDI